jgi:hypothetical protein
VRPAAYRRGRTQRVALPRALHPLVLALPWLARLWPPPYPPRSAALTVDDGAPAPANARAGNARWSPAVSEYREAKGRHSLHSAARPLLQCDPPAAAQGLAAATTQVCGVHRRGRTRPRGAASRVLGACVPPRRARGLDPLACPIHVWHAATQPHQVLSTGRLGPELVSTRGLALDRPTTAERQQGRCPLAVLQPRPGLLGTGGCAAEAAVGFGGSSEPGGAAASGSGQRSQDGADGELVPGGGAPQPRPDSHGASFPGLSATGQQAEGGPVSLKVRWGARGSEAPDVLQQSRNAEARAAAQPAHIASPATLPSLTGRTALPAAAAAPGGNRRSRCRLSARARWWPLTTACSPQTAVGRAPC